MKYRKDGVICKICGKKNRIKERSRQCEPCKYKKYANIHRKSTIKIRNRNKKFVTDFKQSSKCAYCGINDHRVLAFHHTNPKIKKQKISRLANNHAGLNVIKKEIDKCIVLCCNCHAIVHWK